MVLHQNEIVASQLKAKATVEKIERMMPMSLKIREEHFLGTYIKHKGNSFSKLQHLYEFMDDLYAFVGKFIPCKKGCTHCCHIPVSISELEVEFITKLTNNRRAKTNLTVTGNDDPCPFLKRGACAIYKARPFVCRQHVMLDETSKWCQVDACNDIILTQLKFTEVIEFYNRLLEESRKGSRFDIRAVFDSQG